MGLNAMFEVSTAVKIQIEVFWFVTVCQNPGQNIKKYFETSNETDNMYTRSRKYGHSVQQSYLSYSLFGQSDSQGQNYFAIDDVSQSVHLGIEPLWDS
jgi:hypothetical protein